MSQCHNKEINRQSPSESQCGKSDEGGQGAQGGLDGQGGQVKSRRPVSLFYHNSKVVLLGVGMELQGQLKTQ